MKTTIHPHVYGTTEECFPLFRCPQCHVVGIITDDQLHGREPITHECGYDLAKDWSKPESETSGEEENGDDED